MYSRECWTLVFVDQYRLDYIPLLILQVHLYNSKIETGYCTHCWNNVIWSMLFILRLKWEINVDINDANKQKLVRSSIFIINLFLFFFVLNFYNCKSCCMRNWLFYCIFSVLLVFILLFSFLCRIILSYLLRQYNHWTNG